MAKISDREYFSNKLEIFMNSEMSPEDIMATLNELEVLLILLNFFQKI